MTVDLTDFEQASSRSGGCGIVPFLGRLNEDQRVKVIAAMDAPVERIKHSAIRKVVAGWGIEDLPTSQMIGTHRRRQCSCPTLDGGTA